MNVQQQPIPDITFGSFSVLVAASLGFCDSAWSVFLEEDLVLNDLTLLHPPEILMGQFCHLFLQCFSHVPSITVQTVGSLLKLAEPPDKQIDGSLATGPSQFAV